MQLAPLVVTLASLLSAMAAADPKVTPPPDTRTPAAAAWIDATVLGKGTVAAPSSAHPVKVVFDARSVFSDASSACAKLRTATLITQAELDGLVACFQTALHDLGLDNPQASDGPVTDANLRGVKYMFAKSLKRRLVVPHGTRLLSKLFGREISSDQEGAGLALQVNVVVDGDDRIIAVYAYAGGWSYPV